MGKQREKRKATLAHVSLLLCVCVSHSPFSSSSSSSSFFDSGARLYELTKSHFPLLFLCLCFFFFSFFCSFFSLLRCRIHYDSFYSWLVGCRIDQKNERNVNVSFSSQIPENVSLNYQCGYSSICLIRIRFRCLAIRLLVYLLEDFFFALHSLLIEYILHRLKIIISTWIILHYRNKSKIFDSNSKLIVFRYQER